MMGGLLTKLKKRLFMPDMSLEERIFNLLCFVGFFAVLAASFIRGLWISGNIFTFVYLITVAVLLGLSLTLFYKFRIRKGIIIFMMCAVLNVIFPLSFFSGGGIYSGMTAYFVLSLALFFVLLQGKACIFMVCWHIVTAMTCYYLSYTYPELVTPLRAPYMVPIDSVMAIIFSGLAPCLLVKAQTDAYIDEKHTALMAAKARSDFLANISHEIRTPLNAIIGVSEMEMRASKNPENRESLKKMYDSGVALLGIINDILDISKMEAGRFEVLPEPYDFAGLVLDTVSGNIHRAAERPIEFRVNVSENLPVRMHGDEIGIKKIINNLLSNAFKYTNSGYIELEISSENLKDGEHNWLQIVVRDTGQGIKPEDQERIFSDYSKLDKQASAVEGIGIGLTICKNLTEMMGGAIEVQSEPGKGSEFTVIIPQKLVDSRTIGKKTSLRLASAPTMLGASKDNAHTAHFTGNILVVDDVEINLDIVRSIFEEYGLKVDTTAGGEEAVALLEKGATHYDLVFMDHLMPGMNGLESMRAIRKIDSENARNVPIIGLTALERGEGKGDEFFKEIQGFASKPIDVPHLEKILAKWLKKQTRH